MERSEPSLVPEWLKTSGSNTANGTTAHSHSSLLHSDDVPKLARNKTSRNYNDHELGRPSSSDRNSSTYFRRGANSNGSAPLRSYSSFGRNTRRDWDRDRDRDGYERHDGARDRKQRDFLDSPYQGNHERDGLKRSQSMISAKRGESWPKRSMADTSSATRKSNEGNGSLDKGNSVGSMPKVAFEREFPSLVSDEKPSAAEIGRIPSPVLSTLPLGSPMIGTDKWTSALAEAPAVVASTGPQVLPSSSSPVASGTSAGLNMAEAVAQGPLPRLQTAPKTSTEMRLEELAIRQSRQLIPVTPSMPKPLVSNTSDKGKGKAAQQVPTPLHAPFRGVPVKTDASKPSNGGKLLVLKPVWERNGGVSAAKDNLSPTIGSNEITAPLSVATPVAGSKGSANSIVSPKAERKHVHPMLEKKPTTAQSRSRHDFFNLVRKKSLPNSPAVPEAGPAVTSSPVDEPGEVEVSTGVEKTASLADISNVCKPMENNIAQSSNNDGTRLQNGKNHATSPPLFSEEEEAAFLHKLGWQENADEGEGEGALTEEEISAFFNKLSKYVNSKPSVKILQGVEPKFPMLLSSQVRAVSNGLSSSDTNVES